MEEGKERKRKRPALRPEVAGPLRIMPEKPTAQVSGEREGRGRRETDPKIMGLFPKIETFKKPLMTSNPTSVNHNFLKRTPNLTCFVATNSV